MHVSFRTQRGIAHPARQIPRCARDDKRTRTTYDRMKRTPMSHPKPNALSWRVVSVIVIALDKWTQAWVQSILPGFQPDREGGGEVRIGTLRGDLVWIDDLETKKTRNE